MPEVNEVRSGRRIMLVYLGLVLALSVATITLYVARKGPAALPPRVLRFGLTVGLCVWLYSGSNAAKWISVVLFGAGGAAAFAMPLQWSLPALAYVGFMASLYLSFAWMLVFSPEVNAFLAQQRARRGRG
jgi:hypothetical protein